MNGERDALLTQPKLADLRTKLNRVLERRDELFPKRDPQNTVAMEHLTTAYAEAVKVLARSESGWTPDKSRVQDALMLVESPVFICGYKKSGTTFLASLLDGHPHMTVLPGDSRMVHRIRTLHHRPYTQRVSEQHTYWLTRLINPRGQKPFWFLGTDNRPYLDFSHYLTYWLDKLPMEDRSLFLAVVLSLYCANPHRASPGIWVEKTTGNEARVPTILDLFPQARFVHIVRNPMAVLAAIKRLHHHRNRRWSQGALGAAQYILSRLLWRASGRRIRVSVPEGVLSSCLNLYRSMHLGCTNQTRLGENRYYVIRYEDIVTHSQKEMQALAQFLHIPWDPSLLIPTSNGKPTASNSMYEDRRPERGQILSQISTRWKEELNRSELRIIRICLRNVSKEWGYSLQ